MRFLEMTAVLCLALSSLADAATRLPNAEQLDAAKRFAAWPDLGSVTWDTTTGAPSAIEMKGLRPSKAITTITDAEVAARKWLWDHATLFGLRPGRDDFGLPPFGDSRRTEDGFEVRLGQRFDGLPVHSPLTIWLDDRGRFVRYEGSFYRGIELQTEPKFSARDAASIVWRRGGGKGRAPEMRSQLAVDAWFPSPRLVWLLTTGGEYMWSIDAVTGEMAGAYSHRVREIP